MAKPKKPTSTFEAVVEFKYGRGKKAQIVKLPVTIDFRDVYVASWQNERQAVEDDAIEKAFDVEMFNKVLNLKDLTAAYKAWLKSDGG